MLSQERCHPRRRGGASWLRAHRVAVPQVAPHFLALPHCHCAQAELQRIFPGFPCFRTPPVTHVFDSSLFCVRCRAGRQTCSRSWSSASRRCKQACRMPWVSGLSRAADEFMIMHGLLQDFRRAGRNMAISMLLRLSCRWHLGQIWELCFLPSCKVALRFESF